MLDFCTKPQYATHVAKLSGIIALGPLLLLTFPAPTLKVWAVRAVSRIVPWMTIPAPMPEEVSDELSFTKRASVMTYASYRGFQEIQMWWKP